MVLSV